MKLQEISLAAITAGGHRKASRAKVEKLAESIREVGLLHPIAVTSDNRLVHGRHRMEAYHLMDRSTIPAIVLEDADANKIELAEIDENLIRCDLTKAQQAKALKRRKEIYLELHPETGHGGGAKGVRGKPKRKDCALESFAQDTAAKTGKSRRTVETAVKLGADLSDEAVEILGDHIITDNQRQLRELANLSEQDQVAVATEIFDGGAKTVAEARRRLKQADEETEEEKALARQKQLERVAKAIIAHQKEIDSLLSNAAKKALRKHLSAAAKVIREDK